MGEALSRLVRRLLAPFLLGEARCAGCGRAFARASDASGSLCPDCSAENGRSAAPAAPAEPGPWKRCIAAGAYDGRLRDMILAYKFRGRLDLGRQLQELLAAAFARGLDEFPELAECDMIVPVPLHPRRLLLRGYNQSREIARLVSAGRGLPIVQEALSRVRRTTPQRLLDARARVANIRGAFAARRELVDGRRALLVDDILTTGATLAECARTLSAAGARRVDVLVLARA